MDILSAFNNCFKVSFEFLAGFALLAILLILYRSCPKREIKKEFFSWWILLSFFAAAFFWRSWIDLLSSRYASIFILPAVAAGAWGAWFLPSLLFELGEKWSKKPLPLFRRSQYTRLAGRLLILILLIIFTGKMLRYNKFGNFYEKSGRIICEEVKKNQYNAVVIEFCGDHHRISHYTKQLCIPYPNLDSLSVKDAAFLRDHLPNGFDAAYIYCNFREAEEVPPSLMGADKDQWQRIFVSPRNNRKKSYIHVYRFRPEKKEQ